MKDLKISNELLGTILNERVKYIYKIGSNPNYGLNVLPYSIHGHGDLKEINICELSFKCIEWLIDVTDNSVEIITNKDDTYVRIYIPNEADFYSEYASDKTEAIIKACEWLLSEVNK